MHIYTTAKHAPASFNARQPLLLIGSLLFFCINYALNFLFSCQPLNIVILSTNTADGPSWLPTPTPLSTASNLRLSRIYVTQTLNLT
jgi:hypothetical protein